MDYCGDYRPAAMELERRRVLSDFCGLSRVIWRCELPNYRYTAGLPFETEVNYGPYL